MCGMPGEHAVSCGKHVALGMHLFGRVHWGGRYGLHSVRGGNLQECGGVGGLLAVCSRDVQGCDWARHVYGMPDVFLVVRRQRSGDGLCL